MTKQPKKEYQESVKKYSQENKILHQMDRLSDEYKKQKEKVDNLFKEMNEKLNETL